MNPLRRFAVTVSYVSRLPLARLPEDDRSEIMHGLAKYLPAAGLLIGAILAALALALEWAHVNNILAGTIVAVAWLAITGGIHFDGLMDTADGIFSQRDQKRMLEIMTDSRVGNFGAMIGMSVFILKVAALASLPLPALLAAVMFVPAWARWCEAVAIGCFPYLRESGMGKVWHDTMKFPADAFIGGALPAAATAAALYLGIILPLFAALLTMVSGLSAAFYLNRILQGHTGDTYGAVVEIAEVGALTALALLINVPAFYGAAIRF